MKLSIALAGLGVALAAGVAAAEEAKPQVKTERHVMIVGGPGGHGKMDKNGDGDITREEFLAPHADVFVKLDADKNGKISKAELENGGVWETAGGDRMVMHGPAGFHGAHGDKRVHVLELDGEGPGGPGEKRVEVVHVRHGGEGPDGMDANKDGKISPDEFAAPMRKAFEAMDADKSGFIEEGERANGGPMRMKFEKRIETKEDKKAG